jgi:hypothetical protein
MSGISSLSVLDRFSKNNLCHVKLIASLLFYVSYTKKEHEKRRKTKKFWTLLETDNPQNTSFSHDDVDLQGWRGQDWDFRLFLAVSS